MRTVLQIMLLTLGLLPVWSFAETVTVAPIDADISRNVVLKKIDQKLGNRLLALVIDCDGREQHIFITSDDALEFKRGLWVIRPGIYQIGI